MTVLTPTIDEAFTPALHFRSPFGWINDPNGLVFADGLWHLFYQFHPMSTVWGPMHWGHAVSDDLLNWKHLPVALAPDVLGNIFSGSCVVDERNASGLFAGESRSNLLAYYTSSLPQAGGCPDLQTQSLACSHDGGQTWVKWSGNPAIGNPGLVCYRDPKVIWFEPGKCWVMLLTHGQSIGFYRSTNLLDWTLMSEFGEHHGHHSEGPWECPDLFELGTAEGDSRWILVVGVGDGCPASGSGTQYFVGDFDGRRFTSQDPPERVRWLDLGRDHYATQSWFAAPQDRRVAVAWMSNWRYARNTVTRYFRGVMTLPRDLSLVRDATGWHCVAQRFVTELDDAFVQSRGRLSVGETREVPSTYRIRGRVVLNHGDSLRIRLFDDDYHQFVLQREGDVAHLQLERRVQMGDDVLQRELPHRYQVSLPWTGSDMSLDLVVDAGTVELLLDEGRHSITQLFFPRDVAGAVHLSGTAKGRFDLSEMSME